MNTKCVKTKPRIPLIGSGLRQRFSLLRGLGVVAATIDKIGIFPLWLLAIVAFLAQMLWLLFIARSIEVRQCMFLRQRQIEAKLGIMKSISITAAETAADNPPKLEELKRPLPEEQRAELEDFVRRFNELPKAGIEKRLIPSLNRCLKCFGLGMPGRGALYGLSFIVAISWFSFAIYRSVLWDRLWDYIRSCGS